MKWWVERTKKAYTTLDYIEDFLNLDSTITECISISIIPLGITSYAIGLKICAITAEIKEGNKHNKIVLLAKSQLNTIEILISYYL